MLALSGISFDAPASPVLTTPDGFTIVSMFPYTAGLCYGVGLASQAMETSRTVSPAWNTAVNAQWSLAGLYGA